MNVRSESLTLADHRSAGLPEVYSYEPAGIAWLPHPAPRITAKTSRLNLYLLGQLVLNFLNLPLNRLNQFLIFN